MSEEEKEEKRIETNDQENQEEIDVTDSSAVKPDDQDHHEMKGSGSGNDDKKDQEMTIGMNKPWPPLLAELAGKPRSYSDTSPRRQIINTTKGDIRSCTSYMHFPHIFPLKTLSHLRDSSSTPHLHQSFSHMHLPHSVDPNDDFPTVSVIALAEARDKDGDDEVIGDDNIREYIPTNNIEDLEDFDTEVEEQAIYTWDREFGRTRSLSEPTDFNDLADTTQGLDQRPRAMSLESVDKAKKPPSRILFRSTLEELAEEHNIETKVESTNDDTELDNLTTSSVLLLAESRDFDTDPSQGDSHGQVKESDSQDEVLTRWTRYETHPIKKPSFCAELSTIDENLGESTIRNNQSRSASVLALVDEVTKEVLSNESLVNEGLAVQTGSQFGGGADIPSRLIMRRTTLASATPTREIQSYATEIERQAFNKISQWKTDFAVKLEDVLSKGIVRKPDEKKQKSVVVNVPMDLTNDELRNLKGDMLTEFRRKSEAGELKKRLASRHMLSEASSSLPKDIEEQGEQQDVTSYSEDARDPILYKEMHQKTSSSTEDLNKTAISKEYIKELLQWHDKERERLLLELKKMQVSSESSESPSPSAQVVFDSTGLERVFFSIQGIMDSIFKETILRLRGTLESDVLKEERSEREEVQVAEQKYEEKESSRTMEREKTENIITKKEKKDKEEEEHKKLLEMIGKITKDTTAKQTTRESGIPGPIRRTKQKQVKISSRVKPGSASAVNKKGSTKSPSSIHVHTTSFAENECHRETCAGMAEDSSLTCECDSGSDEIYTTDLDQNDSDETTELSGSDLEEYYEFSDFQIKKLRGRPDVFPGGSSSTNGTDITPSSSTSIPQMSSTTDKEKDNEKSEGFSSEELEEEDSEDFEESDACSEIADLLGVYQVYNAVNNHDQELPRPHAPELMTYEEKDMRDEINRQKVRLKGYRRMVRTFKTKNKRLKEERRRFRRQIQEWHERCAKKEARISELKREIEPISSKMENYRKGLEEKLNVIKMKDMRSLGSDAQGHGDILVQDSAGKSVKESSLEYENTNYLKAIIRDKEKVIQELVSQHEKTFQELTKKVHQVMGERDELKKDNLKLKTKSKTEELERKKRNLEIEVSRLEKELKEAKEKYEEKEKLNEVVMNSLQKKLHEYNERHNEDSRLLFETQRSYEQQKALSSSAIEEQEKEISSLKASLNAFQNFVQGLNEEQRGDSQKQLVTNSEQADHNFMNAALKEAIRAKEDEMKLHQQTQNKLREANQKLKNINSVFERTAAGKENAIVAMKKQLQSLEDENSKLKRHLKEKQDNTSILIEVTELQAKVAQRDCEIKELKQGGMKQQQEIKKLLEQSKKQSPLCHSRDADESVSQGKTCELSHNSDGKCLSLAQRCARQWKEETDLQQQELDELRGIKPAEPQPDTDQTLRLRRDVTEIKNALENFLRIQKDYRIIARDELKEKLELKDKEIEKQESLYRQIIETKEKAYAEIVKEKNIMIQTMNESKNLIQKGQTEVGTESLRMSIEDAIEKFVNQKIDELRMSIEMISKLPQKCEVLHEVTSDLLKVNQNAVKRLEDCTEQAWTNVKEDVDELKDFTFKMTDAIEQHFYSTHEHLLNNSIEEVIKYVKNESNGVRKSFLEGMQAHYEVLVDEIRRQETTGLTRCDNLQTSIESYNRCNVREFHQARRDVLLAAEAVSNTAEELYQIKKALLQEFPPKDVIDKDECLRQGQMSKRENEVKEKMKIATKTLEKIEDKYSSKVNVFETSSLSKEGQLKGPSKITTVYSRDGSILNTTAELASQEGTRLRDSLSSMSGELGRMIQEDDLRHGYQPAYQTPPSRESDGLSLRERLQQRAKARATNSEGVSHSDPHTMRSTLFWSRDKPSSAK